MKQLRRDLFWLFGLALLIRLLAALPQQQPNYMDAAYSYVNAVNLAAGRGFVEDFVWNYLGNPEPPPRPSHQYWMPLTSMLAGLGMIVGGISYRAAQMPFVLVSALLVPISYWTTVQALQGKRWQGWLAGLLAIFSGFYLPFWTAIDNFTPFGVAGSLALLFAWQGLKGNGQPGARPSLYLFAAGLFAGLAHLARADGLLLLITMLIFYFVHLLVVSRFTVQSEASQWDVSRFKFFSHFWLRSLTPLIFLLTGYLVVMLPWFIRNWQVTGAFLPVAGSQTIWLTGYDDLFSYGREVSLSTFLAQGWGPILQGRWWSLVANLQTVLAVWGMIFLAPLAMVGSWRLRYHSLIQLAGLYALLLCGAMTLVFAFPGARGGLFHSGAALLPIIYGTAAIGLDLTVDWIAARRRHWEVQSAKRVFGVGLLVMALLLSSFIYYNRVLKNDAWNRADLVYAAVAEWIATEDPTATVMVNNPPAYRFHGGGLSVVVPNENLETTLQAARHYSVDYLILDANHPAPLAEIYNEPQDQPRLSLVKTFGDVYIFRILWP